MMNDAENTAKKQRGKPFKPGQSGNVAGRPKGARNRATVAAEALLEGEAESLTRRAIEMAMAGDSTALRLCLERIMPPRKDRLITLSLPPITGTSDAAKALNATLAAAAGGQITLSEAGDVMKLIELCRKAIAPDAPPTAAAPILNVSFVRTPEAGPMRIERGP